MPYTQNSCLTDWGSDLRLDVRPESRHRSCAPADCRNQQAQNWPQIGHLWSRPRGDCAPRCRLNWLVCTLGGLGARSVSASLLKLVGFVDISTATNTTLSYPGQHDRFPLPRQRLRHRLYATWFTRRAEELYEYLGESSRVRRV